MRMPPYGKTVAATPAGYWDRGTRVLVFAGPKAWTWCKQWLAVDGSQLPQARHRYTLVLPPDMIGQAGVLRWPVQGREVVVLQCGGSAEGLSALIEALQRDGCRGGEVIDVESLRHVLGWEFSVRALQPWSWALWDSEVMRAYRAHCDAEQAAVEAALVDAWAGRLPTLPGGLAFAQSCPPGSVGEAVLARLALRASAEAA